MSGWFLSPLRTEKISARRWLLTDDLAYQTNLLHGIFIAPRGFQTDLASIPRILWPIAPKVDLYDAAAVIHDAAYAHALVTADGERVELVKVWADLIFREAILSCGVSEWRAHLMYLAVKRFGHPEHHPLAANSVTEALAFTPWTP
jgi:Protein of unknown function (DUF1353)